MNCRLGCLSALAAAVTLAPAASAAAEITAERSDGGVLVKIDGQAFAEYLVDSGGKPILWPIIGPTGKSMTRAYPMGEGPNEHKDHQHHSSMWFTHGDVNGQSFWHSGEATIKHREFAKIESGRRAVIVTRNDWLATDGKRVCEDERTLTFGTGSSVTVGSSVAVGSSVTAGDTRWIDFDITVRATDGPVKFGDTKEGTMGVRVAGTMKVDAGLGGRIINSEGQTDKGAWGKPAAWVDYHGPIDGETLGIAILNHPSSFRFPTYWHVRTYGLFAANPFGLHHFEGSDEVDGSHTMTRGETMTLRYRVLLHRGDEKAAKIAEAFSAYSKEAK